jgi:hypothetical protein
VPPKLKNWNAIRIVKLSYYVASKKYWTVWNGLFNFIEGLESPILIHGNISYFILTCQNNSSLFTFKRHNRVWPEKIFYIGIPAAFLWFRFFGNLRLKKHSSQDY